MAGNDKFDSIKAVVKSTLPEYSSTCNAPQTEASVVYIDGSGDEDAGIYAHDGSGYSLQMGDDDTLDVVEDGAETGRSVIQGFDHSPRVKGERQLGPTFDLVNNTTTVTTSSYTQIGQEFGPPYIPMSPSSVPIVYCYLRMTADTGTVSVRINGRNRQNDWGLPPIFEITNQASDRGEVYSELYADSLPMVTSARHDLGGSVFRADAKASSSGNIHPSSHVGIMYESL